ncbi:hypothetical protein SMD11_6856 [Streptomyces albireticuli]|uniref:Uncharacterized protein n=1 Tax=Streptomyces albireticuli TaxID=1940 RepID=A0A1Z2LDS7_9ACTN|nr:hypothetical protein [Streptomyces albireticuli]ARZ72432.1 hypothetical protein SMD11_6856 [Streptomyces albireticuli]
MTTTATALAYSVHTSPAPLRVGTEETPAHATVRITLANSGPDPVSCGTIAFAVPVGKEADALTAAPDTIRASTDDAGWSAEHQGGGIFHVRPAAPGTELKPGARIVVTLADVTVNHTVGAVTLGISESGGTDGGTESLRPAPGGLRLAKASPTAMLEDFRPDQVDVPHGGTVKLTWKCEVGPEYELFYGDQRRPANGFIDADGNGEWTSPGLTSATAFMILGTTVRDGSPVTYGLTTAVTVTVPDLEVGDLDVNGSVRLFGQAAEIAGGTESSPAEYEADTDGVITGYIKTTQDQVPAELKVFVTPPGLRRQQFATQSWDARGGTLNQEASLFVPVPKGSRVRVVQKGETSFSAALTWFPFGAGALTTPPPQ